MSDSEQNSKKPSDGSGSAGADQTTRTHVATSGAGRLTEEHPQQVGQYHLMRVIASGGMGTVFEALQENPRRPVAVKVVKSTLPDEAAVERLKYEAQLLARLRHPGIAQIYEAGTYEEEGTQVPFFAMEYIPNARSIVAYAKEKDLDTRERLELFLQVCDAVHHGHQRGIVHRDLKPSNILVDSAGRVRIIDFGLARATDADMQQAAVHSEYGKIIGSVQYMSPEQFDADPHDIDTRSDVYTLGLILYELLSGVLPYKTDSDRINDFAIEVRSGTKVPLGERDKSLRGEIEAIIHKAIERDRDNRYQSAFGLEQDIRSYLAGDVVIARRPGFGYQTRVFARRHKGLLALTGSVFLVLLVGIVITTSLLLRVEEERERAEAASQKANAGLGFLTETLASAFPPGFGRSASAIDFLDVASQRLTGAFPDEPEVEAELHMALGSAYMNTGQWEQSRREVLAAITLYTISFGEASEEVLDLRRGINRLYQVMGGGEEQVQNARELVAGTEKRWQDSESEIAYSKGILASALMSYGSYDEARDVSEEVWKVYRNQIGEDSSDALYAQTEYAWLLLKTGDVAGAEEVARDALERSSRVYGENHTRYKSARSCLAGVYIVNGHLDSAQALYDNVKVPAQFGIERTFQGELDFTSKPYQVLVFFATWCPFSNRAMPKLDKLYRQYRPFGLNVLGFTQEKGDQVDEKIEDLLAEQEISFAAFRENGRAWNYFGCTGTPSVRLLHDGYLIWEHVHPCPDRMPTEILEALVATRTAGLASPTI